MHTIVGKLSIQALLEKYNLQQEEFDSVDVSKRQFDEEVTQSDDGTSCM